jgi:hypothetical protein
MPSEDPEICSQEAQQRGWCRGLVARRCSLLKWVELVVAVDDIGQAPKVEDLARSKSVGHD